VTFLLVAWDLLSQPLLNLSHYIEINRQEYYDLLLRVSQKGEWEDWLLFFLAGVHNQAEDTSHRIISLEDLRSAYRAKFAKDRSRKTLGILVDYLIGSPITSITQAQETLNIGSFNMIQRNIEKLEALEIVREVTGNKRNRIYHAEEILKVLEERV
jgi:Fic family protein